MKQKQFIYGWLSRSGKQLWVYERESAWGVTEDPKEAAVFPSVQACADHWVYKHRWPEDYIPHTTNGYLKYLDLSTKQTKLF